MISAPFFYLPLSRIEVQLENIRELCQPSPKKGDGRRGGGVLTHKIRKKINFW